MVIKLRIQGRIQNFWSADLRVDGKVDFRPAWGWLKMKFSISEWEQKWSTKEVCMWGKRAVMEVRSISSEVWRWTAGQRVWEQRRKTQWLVVVWKQDKDRRISKTAQLFNAVSVSFSHTPAYTPKHTHQHTHTHLSFHSTGIYLLSQAENRPWLSISVRQARHAWRTRARACAHTLTD